jgi:hypothetical protein
MKFPPHPFILCVVLALSAWSQVRAQVIASDSFDYPVGSLNGQSGGMGWTGNWAASTVSTAVVSGGLSYSSGSISITGGGTSMRLGASANGDNSQSPTVRQFASQTGSDVYFSFLFSSPYGSPAANDDYFSVWAGNSTPTPFSATNVFQAYERIATGSNVGFGVNAGGNVNSASLTAQPNVTYLIVGRITNEGTTGTGDNYDRIELYLNPTSATLPATPNAAVNMSGAGLANVDRIGFRFALLDDVNDQYLVDNLVVGSSFASVVPENQTCFLLGLAGILLGFRRWRKTPRSI